MTFDNWDDEEMKDLLYEGWQVACFPGGGFEYLNSPSGKRYNFEDINELQSKVFRHELPLSPEESSALKLYNLSSRMYS
ncbi:MAG: hypothetical protein PVJ67_01145 [Candidatus Pacearchaeota archaeon]|jgi:hypothetical protein